ncbi:hypothetical protein FQN54_003324 [Arachnomyces sp. PD_36]|nr:hypothetical protein FQN54_003324 [Arachnomyces sp. PD_36]
MPEMPAEADSPEEIIRNAKWEDCVPVGRGTSCKVYRVNDVAVKIRKIDGIYHAIEKAIYERLGDYKYIVKCYGETPPDAVVPRGLMLEYHPAGTLLQNLSTDSSKSAKWPLEAAEAVTYIHAHGVIHGDIGAHNFFLKRNGSIVLGDFGGSRLDWSHCRVLSSPRYTRGMQLSEYSREPIERDDLFALGGVIYEITAKKRLYGDKPDSTIRILYLKKLFPDVSSFSTNIRVVVEKCWNLEYECGADTIRDLKEPASPSRIAAALGCLLL